MDSGITTPAGYCNEGTLRIPSILHQARSADTKRTRKTAMKLAATKY
jgi:hypothetical protein